MVAQSSTAPLRSMQLQGKTFVVDPGHGGKDPGAGEFGFSRIPEKVLVLDIANKVAQKLQSKGATVYMTRSEDIFIPLDDRAAMATQTNADALISIHVDAHESISISGATFYIARNASKTSQSMARNLQSTFIDAGIATRGIRRKNFRVLAAHSRPSILIECGYITHQNEARQLNSAEYRSILASLISRAITKSF